MRWELVLEAIALVVLAPALLVQGRQNFRR